MLSEQVEGMSTPLAPRNLYSVFSTDLQDMKYASLAPLSAYIWKHHLDVTPIVYISSHSSQLSRVGQLLVDGIEMYGGEVRIMPRRPGDLVPSTLQNVRLAAFQSRMLRPEDYLITADALGQSCIFIGQFVRHCNVKSFRRWVPELREPPVLSPSTPQYGNVLLYGLVSYLPQTWRHTSQNVILGREEKR